MVRDVLRRHWDPIGVRDVTEANDEYDSYVPKIAEILVEGADQYALGRHLTQLEHASMGLPGNPPRCDRAARALVMGYHRLLLCPTLRDILETELKKGNKILETSLRWPRDDSVFIRLTGPVTTEIAAGLDRRDVHDPHCWKTEIYDRQTGHMLAW